MRINLLVAMDMHDRKEQRANTIQSLRDELLADMQKAVDFQFSDTEYQLFDVALLDETDEGYAVSK
jgi:hypothetical protein